MQGFQILTKKENYRLVIRCNYSYFWKLCLTKLYKQNEMKIEQNICNPQSTISLIILINQ